MSDDFDIVLSPANPNSPIYGPLLYPDSPTRTETHHPVTTPYQPPAPFTAFDWAILGMLCFGALLATFAFIASLASVESQP